MSKKAKDIAMFIIAGILVLGIIMILLVLLYVDIPEANVQPVNLTLGALIGAFTTIVSFYYGSSKGSAEKTEMLNQKPTP